MSADLAVRCPDSAEIRKARAYVSDGISWSTRRWDPWVLATMGVGIGCPGEDWIWSKWHGRVVVRVWFCQRMACGQMHCGQDISREIPVIFATW